MTGLDHVRWVLTADDLWWFLTWPVFAYLGFRVFRWVIRRFWPSADMDEIRALLAEHRKQLLEDLAAELPALVDDRMSPLRAELSSMFARQDSIIAAQLDQQTELNRTQHKIENQADGLDRLHKKVHGYGIARGEPGNGL